jgi:hypothetical protein
MPVSGGERLLVGDLDQLAENLDQLAEIRDGKRSMSSTRMRGFKAPGGSWKMICMSRHSARSASGDRRYIPPRIRQIAGATNSATLVRGKDTCGNFEHEPRPAADCEAAALAAVTERQQKVLYRGTGASQFRS